MSGCLRQSNTGTILIPSVVRSRAYGKSKTTDGNVRVIGAAACLLSALCWATAIAWYRQSIAELGPMAVNLGKCLFGTILLGATAWFVGDLPLLGEAPRMAIIMVALSGIVGMSLGDWALFAAVDRLGAHRTLLFQTLGPVFAALLAFVFLGEQQTIDQILGAAGVLAGVAVVLAPGSSATHGDAPRADLMGVVFALLAALGQGAGVVLAKGGMAELPVAGASFLRLGTALLGVIVMLILGRTLVKTGRSLMQAGVPRRLFGPSLLGTYIAFLLMMFGIDSAPVATSAVLLSTTPIFALFIDAATVGQKITLRSLLGTGIAVAGVAFLVL